MKRLTVMRMLTKRLAESKSAILVSYNYEDCVNIMGGDNSKESQFRMNMKKDIEQLEICIKALKIHINP